jgi:hypothetical protein
MQIESTTAAPANISYWRHDKAYSVIAMAVVRYDDLPEPRFEPVYIVDGAAQVGRTAFGFGELMTAEDAKKKETERFVRSLEAARRCKPS